MVHADAPFCNVRVRPCAQRLLRIGEPERANQDTRTNSPRSPFIIALFPIAVRREAIPFVSHHIQPFAFFADLVFKFPAAFRVIRGPLNMLEPRTPNPEPCTMQTDSAIIRPAAWTRMLPVHAFYPVSAPLELDLGAGKGRFLLARAEAHPYTNFLGVDRLLVRLRKIDRHLGRRGLSNVRLLRIEIAYAVEYLLPPTSVSTVYAFFPDPWPKKKHHRRRLFTPAFIDSLYRLLRPGGSIHIATDHADYFSHMRALFDADPRFDGQSPFMPAEQERTDFEMLFTQQGLSIGRCSFRRRQSG